MGNTTNVNKGLLMRVAIVVCALVAWGMPASSHEQPADSVERVRNVRVIGDTVLIEQLSIVPGAAGLGLKMDSLLPLPKKFRKRRSYEIDSVFFDRGFLEVILERNEELRSVSKCIKLYRFKPKQFILPGALIALGTVGVYWKSFRHVSNKINTTFAGWRKGHYYKVDDFMQYLPTIVYPLLGFSTSRRHISFKERLAVEVTAYAAMFALQYGGMFAVREKCPESSSRTSFPAAHTAVVYTGAELMRIEYGDIVGAAAYTVATATAFLQMYNGKHWFHDVIAGVGVGILSARIGYWMLPLYRKWFKWDRKSLPLCAFSPTYNAGTRTLGLSASIMF